MDFITFEDVTKTTMSFIAAALQFQTLKRDASQVWFESDLNCSRELSAWRDSTHGEYLLVSLKGADALFGQLIDWLIDWMITWNACYHL